MLHITRVMHVRKGRGVCYQDLIILKLEARENGWALNAVLM